MLISLTMPQLGLTMTEGTISSWAVKPGDAVKKDEVLFTVSTDKADMDVEATADGVINQILIGEGETVPVGAVLVRIDVAGDGPEPPTTEQLPIASVPNGTDQAESQTRSSSELLSAGPASAATGREILASPRARRRANELGIEIETVVGTGDNGRIVEEDLIKAAAHRSNPVDADTRRRLLIAARMVESINTIPSFSLSVEVNAEKLVKFYQETRGRSEESGETRLTYTDLLCKATALSLAESAEMNSVWKEGTVQRCSAINLALAIATDRGVVAPVLRDVHILDLQDIIALRHEVAAKARANKLVTADFDDAIGALSNLGMYRVDSFTGIITPGQTFILAVGQLRSRPWAEASLSIKPTIILNLSVDHRVVDGAVAALFLQRVVAIIEDFEAYV
jgi:pyruvate dehydrogenase E2 component (dihydrolipoamide acetyltransferase)